jgi:DNA primase
MMSVEELAAIVAKTVPTLKLISRAPLWQGLCPFHNEHTPSFQIFYSKRFDTPWYYCQGCGATGGAIRWLMKVDGKTFREANGGPLDRQLLEERKQERTARQHAEMILAAYHDWRPDCVCPEWLLETK